MLRELQREVAMWSYQNFPENTPEFALMGLVEEVGELNHARLKQLQGIRKDEDLYRKERDAVGDIVIYLLDYCTRRGIDAQQAVEETWQVVRRRDWRTYPETGHPVGEGEKYES